MTTLYAGLDIARLNLQLHLGGRVHDLPNTATGQGWIYLAVILDACSRRLVGWAMSVSLETTLVTGSPGAGPTAPSSLPVAPAPFGSGSPICQWRVLRAPGRLPHDAQHEPGGQSV